MNKKILLFSGGLDCTLQYHFIKPDVCLYVDMGTACSSAEKKFLKKHPLVKNVVVTPKFPIGFFEKESTSYIPYRNLFLLTIALQYGNEIFMGLNYFDNAPDKDAEYLRKSNSLIKHLSKDKYVDFPNAVIKAPYKKYTKTEMLKKYLKEGYDVKDIVATRSCYDERSSKGCGDCSPCMSKAVALLNNNIDINKKKVFDVTVTVKMLQEAFKEQLKWRSYEKNNIEYEKAIEVLRRYK